MGFTHGYCSNCGDTTRLDALDEHSEQHHAGDWIYLTFYKPDPIHMAANQATADQLLDAAAEVEDPPSQRSASAAQPASE